MFLLNKAQGQCTSVVTHPLNAVSFHKSLCWVSWFLSLDDLVYAGYLFVIVLVLLDRCQVCTW